MFEEKKSFLNKGQLKIRGSRKRYFLIYVMVLIVIAIVGYIRYNNLFLSESAFVFAIIFIISALFSTEIHRFMEFYRITTNYLECTVGLFSKKTKKILIESIVDIDLNQKVWQRFLGYGTLNIHAASGVNIIQIKSINNPVRFMDFLEERVDEKLS